MSLGWKVLCGLYRINRIKVQSDHRTDKRSMFDAELLQQLDDFLVALLLERHDAEDSDHRERGESDGKGCQRVDDFTRADRN